MISAQQLTKRTRYIDIKNLALQDWWGRDIIAMRRIKTSDNNFDTHKKLLLDPYSIDRWNTFKAKSSLNMLHTPYIET